MSDAHKEVFQQNLIRLVSHGDRWELYELYDYLADNNFRFFAAVDHLLRYVALFKR